MGMTINEVIKEMEEEWKIFLEGTSLDNPKYREKELAVNDECRKVVEANESAIVYLKKYEKIEQIYSDYLDDMDSEKLADKLGEVF